MPSLPTDNAYPCSHKDAYRRYLSLIQLSRDTDTMYASPENLLSVREKQTGVSSSQLCTKFFLLTTIFTIIGLSFALSFQYYYTIAPQSYLSNHMYYFYYIYQFVSFYLFTLCISVVLYSFTFQFQEYRKIVAGGSRAHYHDDHPKLVNNGSAFAFSFLKFASITIFCINLLFFAVMILLLYEYETRDEFSQYWKIDSMICDKIVACSYLGLVYVYQSLLWLILSLIFCVSSLQIYSYCIKKAILNVHQATSKPFTYNNSKQKNSNNAMIGVFNSIVPFFVFVFIFVLAVCVLLFFCFSVLI